MYYSVLMTTGFWFRMVQKKRLSTIPNVAWTSFSWASFGALWQLERIPADIAIGCG